MRKGIDARRLRGDNEYAFRFSIYIILVTMALGCLLTVPAMGSSTSAKSLSELQRGLAFYQGKAITMICGGSPGSAYYENCSNLEPELDSYLHATVELENISTGNNIPAQDAANSATPNGLTFGELDPGTDVYSQLSNTPGVNFNPERVAFIGTAGPIPSVTLATNGSGIKDFAQLVASTSPVSILTLTTGSGYIQTLLMIGAFDIDARLVTGYANNSALQTGFERGDGQVAQLIYSSALTLVQAGQDVPLALTAPLPAGFPGASSFASVPTLAQFAKSHPLKTKKQKEALAINTDLTESLNAPIFFAGSRVPADRLDALRAAIKFAEHSAAVHALDFKEGLVPGYKAGPTAKNAYIQVLNDAKVVSSFLSS